MKSQRNKRSRSIVIKRKDDVIVLTGMNSSDEMEILKAVELGLDNGKDKPSDKLSHPIKVILRDDQPESPD